MSKKNPLDVANLRWFHETCSSADIIIDLGHYFTFIALIRFYPRAVKIEVFKQGLFWRVLRVSFCFA